MLVCFGFSGGATGSKDVYQSALRLAKGVLDLLQASPAGRAVDPTPHIERYLTDGSLQRYVEQQHPLSRSGPVGCALRVGE
jgi:hypothetical protein